MAENIVELLTDVADAIREKKGSTEKINAQSFADEIKNLPSGGGNGWTGHADAEGLRAIGWTEEDIAYYQQHGVNWNEEDDQYHLVSDDNKALYGVLTADNISTYKDRIVYLPKIDTSKKTSMQGLFDRCIHMVAMPMIDTSQVTSVYILFNRCYSLSCVPPLDFSNVQQSGDLFFNCYALSYLPNLNIPQCVFLASMFASCVALKKVKIEDIGSVTNASSVFNNCYSLREISIDADKITSFTSAFQNCYNVEKLLIKNLKISITLSSLYNLKKESLIYIIENEAASNAITITLEAGIYARLSADEEVNAALAAHPNVSLAK